MKSASIFVGIFSKWNETTNTTNNTIQNTIENSKYKHQNILNKNTLNSKKTHAYTLTLKEKFNKKNFFNNKQHKKVFRKLNKKFYFMNKQILLHLSTQTTIGTTFRNFKVNKRKIAPHTLPNARLLCRFFLFHLKEKKNWPLVWFKREFFKTKNSL